MPPSILALALLLAGCGTTAEVARVVEVRLTCATGDADAPCAFQPVKVTVRMGGMVRWVNDDATFHTVTSSDRAEVRRPSGRFDHVLDEPGDNATVTFTEPGTYPYYCQPHAEFMAGVVHVLG